MSKLKGSSNAIRMKHIVLLFIVSVLVALPLRTYQLLLMVNPENGFYENANAAVPALYISAFVFSALFVVLSFFSKGIPAPRINEGKNIVLGVASLALSVAFVLDVVGVIQTLTPQVMYDYNSYASQTLIATFIKENGGIFVILKLVFGALSALYFFIFGVSYFEGKVTYKKMPLMALSPVIWGMSILISKLMKPVSFITVSELLFEIFAFVFIMVFFLTFARVSTGMFTENGMWSVFGCGFAAILFGGIITVPRLVVSVVGRPAVQGHEFSVSYLIVVIFIGVALFSILGAGFKDGFKGFSGLSDFNIDDEAVIIKGSDKIVVEEEIVEDIEASSSVEAVSDDEIKLAMEKLLDKLAGSEDTEEYSADILADEEIIEDLPEDIVEEIVADEEISVENTEKAVEEIIDLPEEVAEEIASEEEISVENTEKAVEEIIEDLPEEVVEEITADEEFSVENTEEAVEEIIELPEEVAEEIAADEEFSVENTEEADEEIIEELPEEVAEEIASEEEFSVENTEEADEEIIEELPEEVVEEITADEGISVDAAEQTVEETEDDSNEDTFLAFDDMIMGDEEEEEPETIAEPVQEIENEPVEEVQVVEEQIVADVEAEADIAAEVKAESVVETEPVKAKKEKTKKEKVKKEKVKKEKPEKKKLFGKNKKQEAPVEEVIKPISLAEMRKKSDTE